MRKRDTEIRHERRFTGAGICRGDRDRFEILLRLTVFNCCRNHTDSLTVLERGITADQFASPPNKLRRQFWQRRQHVLAKVAFNLIDWIDLMVKIMAHIRPDQPYEDTAERKEHDDKRSGRPRWNAGGDCPIQYVCGWSLDVIRRTHLSRS